MAAMVARQIKEKDTKQEGNKVRHLFYKFEYFTICLFETIREGVKKETDYLVTSIKKVGRYLTEITIS